MYLDLCRYHWYRDGQVEGRMLKTSPFPPSSFAHEKKNGWSQKSVASKDTNLLCRPMLNHQSPSRLVQDFAWVHPSLRLLGTIVVALVDFLWSQIQLAIHFPVTPDLKVVAVNRFSFPHCRPVTIHTSIHVLVHIVIILALRGTVRRSFVPNRQESGITVEWSEL